MGIEMDGDAMEGDLGILDACEQRSSSGVFNYWTRAAFCAD